MPSFHLLTHLLGQVFHNCFLPVCGALGLLVLLPVLVALQLVLLLLVKVEQLAHGEQVGLDQLPAPLPGE